MRSKLLAVVAAWAASIAVAVLLSSSSAPAPAPAPSPLGHGPAARSEGVAPRSAPAPVAGSGLTTADLRAAVRAELAAAFAEERAARVSDETDSDGDADGDPPLGDEAAFVRADDAIAVAMSDGRWSDADRDILREALAVVDTEQASHLLSTITLAVNVGEIIVETNGAPI